MRGYSVTIKEKGRTLLPVALQRAGNFGPGDTFIAHVNDEGDIVLVNRRRVLERMWEAMEVAKDTEAVADLKKVRAEGDAARRHNLENFEVQDEKDLVERTRALLARMSQ